MTKRARWYLAISLMLTSLIASMAMSQSDVNRITMEELNGRLGEPNLIVVDVRARGDWSRSDSKIKGAVRVEPRDAGFLTSQYGKDKTLVFYCS